ncbi:MAG TPA: substrate-binding domain-containing protein [Vicinamibacteria bacterium]|nr:substrate-binding domain-containing protein [Vicinamibacteria bacterium]
MPKVVVGLLKAEQEFQRLQAKDARETGARLGLEVEVVFAEGHAVVQIQQLFRFIHAPEAERPRAIVVEAATAEGLERVARNAAKAAIGWILVNARVSYVDELRNDHPGLPITMLGTDNAEAGRLQGRQCRALLPKGGNVLCVQGPADSTATQDRFAGLKETLGSGFEVRGLNGDWTEASGEKAIAGWLRLKTAETFRPDVVVGQNDSMAAGARKALRALRREWADLPFLGCDGLPEGGQKLVAEGVLAATVVTPSNTGPALEIVARWLRTSELPPPAVRLGPRSHPPEGQIRRRGGR